MKLADRLQQARDSYVRFYRATLSELKSEHADCVAELLVLPNGAQNPEPFSLLRLDAIYGGPASSHPVRVAFPPEKSPAFAEFEHGGVKISLGAVSWERASFSFEASGFQLGALHDWLSTWIDEKGAKNVDELGLAGVVHSIAWNNPLATLWEIIVDFGSAPTACMLELIELLGRQGVTTCILEYSEEEDGKSA